MPALRPVPATPATAARGRRLSLLAAASAIGLGGPAAHALDIVLIADNSAPDAVEDCCFPGYDCCEEGVDPSAALAIHMAVAAAFWEDIIEDPHALTIRYWFSTESSPEADVTAVHPVTGFPTEATIKVPADLNWYYDPNPITHDEFDLVPQLYRTTHPAEQAEAFAGVPHEVLELGFNGRNNVPVGGVDLLTVILHEMGHAVGLHPDIFDDPQCNENGVSYYFPDPALTGGVVVGIKGFEWEDGVDCAHLAVGGITECNGEPNEDDCKAHQALMWPGALPGRRALPSAVDILAVAEAAGWQDLDFPRKFSLTSGIWGADERWMGGRTPDGNDQVYIVNESPTVNINSFSDESARDVFMTSGNDLNIVFSKLDLSGTMDLRDAGTYVTVDSNAELEVSHLLIGPGSEVGVAFADSLVDAFNIENRGEISGAGTVDTTSLDNRGILRASGGTLTLVGANHLDLDGELESFNAELIATVGDIVVDGDVPDPVAAQVTIGSGRTVAFQHGWTLGWSPWGHSLSLTGGDFGPASVEGPSTIQGRVAVAEDARFGDDVTFQNPAQIALADADALLTLEGLTTYEGGTFTGEGTIREMGGVNVTADTTIGPIGVYDMDGDGTTSVHVLAGADLYVEADGIEPSAVDGYDATLSLDGNIVMQTPDPWRLEGVVLMNLAGGLTATIAGSDLRNEGTISIRHSGILSANVHTEAGASIHTIDASSFALFSSGGVNELRGGHVTGLGTMQIQPGSSLHGWGEVEPRVLAYGAMRARDGWLIVHGAMDHVGTVGTVDDTGVLWVDDPWSTQNGLLNVVDGWIAGGNVTNTGTTTGNGFFSMTAFGNAGRLAPGSSGPDGSDGPGILAFTENFGQVESGIFEAQIGGTEVGASDGLIVTGQARLNGTLALSLLPGYFPSLGDEIILMSWGERIGAFATVTGTALPGGLAWELTYEPDTLVLRVVEGCDGDANGDGFVDLSDLLQVLAGWGPCPAPPAGCPADVDHDGSIGFGDVLTVLGNWGACP